MGSQDDHYYSQLQCVDWNSGSFGAQFGDVGLLNDHFSLVIQSQERSTGYLEDAVVELEDHCKRRRVVEEVEDILQGFWNWNCHGDTFADLNFFNSYEDINQGVEFLTYPTTTSKETITQKHQENSLTQTLPISSSNSDKSSMTTTLNHAVMGTSSLPPKSFSFTSILKENEGRIEKKRKRETEKDILYPFTVVKPGGVEGDTTLDDINKRILRRPRRPVRHPVGEFACLPCVMDVNGPGLSGKAVVGLTRIHTQGRGSVTIIRTRG